MILVFWHMEHLQVPATFAGVRDAPRSAHLPVWTPIQVQKMVISGTACSVTGLHMAVWPFQGTVSDYPKHHLWHWCSDCKKCREKDLLKHRACLHLGCEIFLHCKSCSGVTRCPDWLCKFSRNTEWSEGFGFAKLGLIFSYRKAAALQVLKRSLHILWKAKETTLQRSLLPLMFLSSETGKKDNTAALHFHLPCSPGHERRLSSQQGETACKVFIDQGITRDAHTAAAVTATKSVIKIIPFKPVPLLLFIVRIKIIKQKRPKSETPPDSKQRS